MTLGLDASARARSMVTVFSDSRKAVRRPRLASMRPLTDLPVAGYPLVLQVAVPRYRCATPGCGCAVFNQDLRKLAVPRASTARRIGYPVPLRCPAD